MSTIDTVTANYKAAVEADNAKWAQRVAETAPVGNELQATYFQQGQNTEPFRGVEGAYVLNVCHAGVPAQRRFNCGPVVEL